MAQIKDNLVGIDVGGTFTDLICFKKKKKSYNFTKVFTSAKNQSQGVLNAIDKASINLKNQDLIIHGTTTTTNALLERKISKTALITTKGFRDVLELGRRTRPFPYGLIADFKPLIPRNLRFEVEERIDFKGNVLKKLNESELLKILKKIKELNCESIVIHFLHSYANSYHEVKAKNLILKNWANKYVTAGHEILSESREFERGVTASINASVQPILENYIYDLQQRLRNNGYKKELLVMNGNGGTVSSKIVSKEAAKTVMSGPASGVIAATYVSKLSKVKNIITYDMGGTSTDVSLVVNNKPAVSSETEIEYSMPVHVPMVDVRTIGAGGGSIAKINEAGLLEVGPESSGSDPGPICYGNGGKNPTISDANFLLGRLNPESLNVKENIKIKEDTKSILENEISKKLKLNNYQSAEAILKIANNKMANAIRMVSISVGEDPREFNLFSFGGAGPMHACELARELDIPKVFIPARPGLTNALGCLVADLRQDFTQTLNISLEETNIKNLHSILEKFKSDGVSLIKKQKVEIEKFYIEFSLDMQFLGQTHIIKIPLKDAKPSKNFINKEFENIYFKRFKVKLEKILPIIVNINVSVIGKRKELDLKKLINFTKNEKISYRKVYFNGKWHRTPIYLRENLFPKFKQNGPAIIEQLDTTIVIHPKDNFFVDDFGNIIIEIYND